jgi:hypothetical protein
MLFVLGDKPFFRQRYKLEDSKSRAKRINPRQSEKTAKKEER